MDIRKKRLKTYGSSTYADNIGNIRFLIGQSHYFPFSRVRHMTNSFHWSYIDRKGVSVASIVSTRRFPNIKGSNVLAGRIDILDFY